MIDRLRCPVNFEFPGHVETFWQFPYYLLVIWIRLAERVTCFGEDLCLWGVWLPGDGVTGSACNGLLSTGGDGGLVD